MNSRDLTNTILGNFCEQITDGININVIDGLNSVPWITRLITGHETYPFIEARGGNVEDAGLFKNDSTKNYTIEMQIISDQSPTQVNQIADEIIRIIDVNPADLPTLTNDGVDLTRVTVQQSPAFVEQLPSRQAFIKNIIFTVDADFIGLPVDRQPVQLPIFSFSGFTLPVVGNRIELHDSGTITGDTAYASNNGWDFVAPPVYALTSGSQGVLNGNVLTVAGTDDPLGLTTVLNYQFGTDNTILTTIPSQTTTFPRIVSVRIGERATATTTQADLRTLGSWNLISGVTSPTIQRNITGTAGQHPYVVYGANEPDITIRQHVLGGNFDITNQFTRTVIDGYKVYIKTDPLTYDGQITLNIV